MKPFKSIKWRLQIWYGLILVAVLVGFGVTSYQLDRGRQFARIDQELHRRIGLLANALHRPQRRMLDNQDRPFFGGQPPDQAPAAPFQVLRRNRPLPEFRLPPEADHLFGTNTLNDFYYRISMLYADGAPEIARSDNYPQNKAVIVESRFSHYVNQVRQVSGPAGKVKLPEAPPTLDFGKSRVAADFLPSGEFIEVGCSIASEKAELRKTAMNLTAIGSLILLVGLAGGWWLVNRALRPVSKISVAAVKISAGDLSQRINATETESELGQLAAVLNSTFARLEIAFAQQKQFAADAAHELRTPVSVMLTQTQTALSRERDAVSYKDTLEACQRAAQRMRKLIESLLELARFDAGQEVLNRLPFDLANSVNESVDLVQPLAEEFQVKVVSEISAVEITGDSGRLGQVVTNLLTNAIQYNHPGGEVLVRLVVQDGLAILTVTDTGRGIAPTDLPHVFERFYRADTSRTGAGNAGLGLSICKAIVEAHGGTIEVASEVGRGSAFTIRLPA